MEDIQSWWELPSIAHFCSLFRAAFDLLDFDIEELEEAILTDGLDRSGSPLIIELLVRLLQGCLPGKSVTPTNVDSYLRKLFRQKCQEDSMNQNLLPKGEFRNLPLRRKVEVLHALCDFRLEAEDVLELLKNLETESLRVEPLGYDDTGSTYWYFYGTRLYREDNSFYHPFRRRPREKEKDKEDKRKKKRKKKGQKDSSTEEEEHPEPLWQVQCYTEEDWCKLSKKFEGCQSKLEKSLLQTLKDDFLPEIPRLFEEKEKLQQKRMMEFTPRRSSCRVQKLKEKKEEEEKRLAEELVEQEKRRIQEEEKRRLQEEEAKEIDKEVLKIGEETEKEGEVDEAVKEEENKQPKEETSSIPDQVKKKKKKKVPTHSEERLKRNLEREDDVLHERNVCNEPIAKNDSPKHKHQRIHKEKKPHHRKHRKRSHHKNNHHHTAADARSPDSHIVSDTSNKENTIGLDVLSECEDDHNTEEKLLQFQPQPQVYSGRKTNNSLATLAFSLTPSTVVPEPTKPMVTSPPNKKRVKSAHMLLQTEDDLRTGMYKVLEHLREHEDAWPFLDPVEESFAPNYYAVIRRPMYITKMESRLDSGYYTNLTMFEADFKLMMDNCKLYNGPESEYTHMAYTLEKMFAKLKAKYLETEFSSDEEIYIDLSFQQSAKRKNKKRSSIDEKENKALEESNVKFKRKRKKKVGRKPKIKMPEDTSAVTKIDKKLKSTKSKEKEKGRRNSKNKSTEASLEELSRENGDNELEPKEAGTKMDIEEDDDDDDYDEPMLLVREDPYPEDDENDGISQRISPPASDDEREPRTNSYSAIEVPGNVDFEFSNINRWKKEPDRSHDGVLDAESKLQSRETNKEDKSKPHKMKSSESSHKRTVNRERKTKKDKEKKRTKREEGEKEDNTEHRRDLKATNVDISDSDSNHDGVLLYYNHNEDSGSDTEHERSKKDYLHERHNELFGETDDLEEEGKTVDEGAATKRRRDSEFSEQKHGASCTKKKKGVSSKDKKKHKHHHHHHHRSKSKEGKHHHHRRKSKHTSSSGGQDSPSKKVLKVEEVYDYSEEDPNSRDSKDREKDPELVPNIPKKEVIKSPVTEDNNKVKEVVPPVIPDSLPLPTPPKDISQPRKKKSRRKGKHSRRIKRKDGKEKTKGAKKDSKRKGIKKIIKKKRKQIPVQKMAAIDALSAATEQTLKDITILLDDPQVPRFTGEGTINSCSPSDRVTSQEFESIALKIEAEYRRKLKMDVDEDKKSFKRKKRKNEDVSQDDSGPRTKKVKREAQCDVKEIDKKLEKEREKTSSDSNSLDNSKDLFKDIKDGRIKPGAIIKSKDIAKKEGMVKKETKPPSEPKPKGKQNPFGKINKQENSKLTTLIAKAKESRIGLVPNSEVGDSPKLSLGSIILFGDIGSGKHSSREPNSPEDEEILSDKLPEKADKWDSPWENRWEKSVDAKDEISNPPSQEAEEEEKEEELEEPKEVTPERSVEELQPPPTPRAPEFKQERATPNLSAWFKAFGGPKLTAAPRKRMDDDDDRLIDDDNDDFEDDDRNQRRDEEIIAKDTEDPKDNDVEDKEEDDEEDEEIKVNSPDSIPEEPVPSPRPPNNNSPEVPDSPQPPLSPDKPPETPWFDKLNDKEEEPIWKNNKIDDDDDDPYKFEEEELDRAREEAKKLEVERQRKASVSSSGLSDPSPLNIDSDRSPAAFSSEGERSPLTRSPATRSPVTPGFGGAKQISPVTEKSPNVPAYSPRYDTGLGKGFAGYEEKNKYQANGTLKVGFYQDMTDKTIQEKVDTPKSLEQKIKESPIYSPTVPYVSPLYANKDQNMCKQKSPGRYSSYYSSFDSSNLDKPKTPGYYSTSAPSTPSDRPSPAAPIPPPEEKPKTQYNYYSYDPTRSLTDQYKNTGSANAKHFYGSNDTNKTAKTPDRSPLNCNTPVSGSITSPAQITIPAKTPSAVEKPELQPPKKRQVMDRNHHNNNSVSEQSQNCAAGTLTQVWGDKREELDRERANPTSLTNPYSPHPLPADLANLSQIVSRIPEPESDSSVVEKEGVRLGHEPIHSQPIVGKTVQPPLLFESAGSLTHHSPVPDLHQPSVLPSRSTDLSSRSIVPSPSPASDTIVHNNSSSQKSSHLQHPPPAHQKLLEGERPGSRNMPPPPSHAGEKSHGYLHQKTMWNSSLPSSIPSSLSSLVSNVTMASIALAGQKGLATFPPEHLAQFGMDRAALASLAGRSSQSSGQLFSHDLLQRNTSNQSQVNPPSMASPSGLSLQPHLNGVVNSGGGSPGSNHSRSSSTVSGSSTPAPAGGGSSSAVGSGSSSSSNFDLGLGRSYASMMTASQSSPLFGRNDPSLTAGSLPRSISGSTSPFLPQSPGLGAALGMSGSSRTPTPAHQQSLSQSSFPSVARDPRDPISQSHPSLQIPSLNSIACSQAQTLNHLNAVSLASYTSRDSLALMNQGGRGPLVGVDPTPQQLYQQYLQRHQLAAQEELLLRSAGAHSQFAHQSMMLQQGLMSAAAASYNSGYPHSLSLRPGSYQGMNRPWI